MYVLQVSDHNTVIYTYMHIYILFCLSITSQQAVLSHHSLACSSLSSVLQAATLWTAMAVDRATTETAHLTGLT